MRRFDPGPRLQNISQISKLFGADAGLRQDAEAETY
jgi:hypothetical protein